MTDENPESSKVLSAPEISGSTSGAKSRRQAPAPTKGVSILGFREESAAREAGMKKGDVILEYDGERNLTTETLSSLATREGTDGTTGIDVVFLRGGRQESLRVPSGSLGISAMDTTIQDHSVRQAASDKIQGIVLVIQRVYWAIALLGSLGLLSCLVKSRAFDALLQDVLMTVLYGVSYIGLRYRRDWVITLILIVSAFSCLGQFVQILQPADSIKALLAKILGIFAFLFFAYQIRFFRKPEVRALFADRGYLVF